MILITKITDGYRKSKIFAGAFIFVLGLLLTTCKNDPEPYSVIDFSGSDEVLNYSKSLYMFSNKADSVVPTALLASDGDLIFYGNECFIYRKSYGNNFQFKTGPEGGYINGKIATLNLGNSKYMIPWFKKMKSEDLSRLDFILIDSAITENYYRYLADLAKIKPGIGLSYSGDIKDISRAIKLFNPRYLVGNFSVSNDKDLLSGLTNLEFLVADLNDSVNIPPLPVLPRLSSLIISDVKNEVVLNDKFLSGNRSVKRVIVMKSKKIDLSFLDPVIDLKELVLTNFDTILNFNHIRNKKSLELLSVISEKTGYYNLPEAPDGIRWMTFSGDFSQNDFNNFIDNHPKLEVAEIIKNESVGSLAPLSKLKMLYGLIITDTLTDLGSVASLKNLKYFSLPSDVLKDKSVKENLQKEMPATRIVANEGFCLGSGWLLLIVPLVAFFTIIGRKKFLKAVRYPTSPH